jgi:antitoxin component of RelBE/YafQ-DinJ toxin-antitoxin module
VTYTTNIRLDDDLAASVKAYAKANGGISIADAIRLLLTQALKENQNAHVPGH